MSKMSTELTRIALNGPTMGSRWSALFFSDWEFDQCALRAALQAAVDEVDAQMSTWKADSDLMRFNAAPLGTWCELPEHLTRVLHLGIKIGQASQGAFDIGMGDATRAWGFGPDEASNTGIRAALGAARMPAYEALEYDGSYMRKVAPIALELNAIAKGYGVDRLAETLRACGIEHALVGIDGEMRALGLHPDGEPWVIAVESPDETCRGAGSILALEDAAVATSGDYRHFVELRGRRMSHTMDPKRGAPLIAPPASVTVVAQSCAEADAWATALMVLGPNAGRELARKIGLNALFLLRGPQGRIESEGIGSLFCADAAEVLIA